jgi:phosphate transport system protein
MSHYEERLQRDLDAIRAQVADMTALVETAIVNAMHALQTGTIKLAAATVLADHAINRSMRKIDQLCHKFIALHLPTAGNLRMLSSAIRANIELERIGDYAVTIAREAIQLSAPPSGPMSRELERVGNETKLMLSQAIKAFNQLNPEMAKSTMLMEEQMENDLDIIYPELMENDDRDTVKHLLAIFAVFTQLKRVADQAKNLCEEAIFAATGGTKKPKVFNIMFIDEDNSCQSQIAEAIARKNFPDSGHYSSSGRQPATRLNPATVNFLESHGISVDSNAKPRPIDMTPLQLTTLHVIVSLQGPVKSYFDQIPFHTTPLEWDVGPAPESDDEAGIKRLEELYRDTAIQVRDLMETLRGEGAP